MQKTKIIKEIIGKRIEPYGFHYLKTDGTTRIFLREVKGIKRYYDPTVNVVKQYINIQEHRFAQEVVVRLSTDAYGHGEELELKEPGSYESWMEYTDEESYREILTLFSELIVKYAFDLLDGISMEEEVIPTRDMAERLYYQSKQLDQSLVEEFHIKVIPETIQDIDEWGQLIRKLVTDSLKYPYKEVKELLVQIAAFIGERACDLCSSKWYFNENVKVPGLIDGKPNIPISPLAMIIMTWRNGCDEQYWGWLGSVIEKFKQGFIEHSK